MVLKRFHSDNSISLFLLVLFFLFFFDLEAQIIKGTIKSVDNELITNCNILIKSDSSSISEYTISKNGIYSIELEKEYSSIIVETSLYGYEIQAYLIEKPAVGKTYTLDFILKPDISDLDEVVVTAKKRPFKIVKDTIKFNVNSYSDGTERKIQDVISKLPGISVNKNSGEIKYKGKAVETVLLEGDNLFGANYSLGTKNINIDIVEQVQAIENYSENELLKGIENGDKVALNLKLKKGVIDVSGNIDVAQGVFDDGNYAVNLNSNLLGITKKYKSFGTFAFNNIGINRTPFNYFSSNQTIEKIRESKLLGNEIIPETSFSSSFDEERVYINNQLFGNYNIIYSLSKNFSIKANLYYLDDEIKNIQSSQNDFRINEDVFSTFDIYDIVKKPLQYRGDLGFKYNTSNNSLLEYNFRFNKQDINTASDISSNGDRFSNSELQTDNIFIKNNLLFTKKITDKKALQFTFEQSINYLPQILRLTPSVFNTDFSNKQETDLTKQYFEGRFNLLASTKKNHKYSISLGGKINKNKIETNLFDEVDSVEPNTNSISSNDLSYSLSKLYLLSNYNFDIGTLNFSLSNSLSYQKQKLEDRSLATYSTLNNTLLEPSLNVKYKFNSVSFLSAKVGYNIDNSAENYLHGNQVLTNNRILITNTPSLELQKTMSYGIFYYNNDLYKQLEINLGSSYQRTEGNYFENSTIGENITEINYFFLPQENENFNFNFLISKYLPLIETTVKLNSEYSLSNYKNIVNQSELRDNSSQSFNSSLNLKTAFDGIINFENDFTFLSSSSKNQETERFVNQAIFNTAKVLIKPSATWFISLSSNYNIPNLERNNEVYNFMDLLVRYNLKNSKKFEFYLVAKNILNNENFEQTQVNDFSTTIYRSNLLSRHLIFNVTYNL